MLRILTDRGTEYCGRIDTHDYQPYLAVNDIEHTKTKVKSPQTMASVSAFTKRYYKSFIKLLYAKKVYQSVDELQTDLD